MRETSPAQLYEDILPEIFDTVSVAIGKHVLLIVLERTVWKTKIKYPEAERIKFSEDGINLDGLENIEPDRAEMILHEFVMSIIDTLSRLVGIQVAQKLTEKLNQ